MKRKSIIVGIPLIILIILSGFLSIVGYKETKKMEKLFDGEVISATLPLVKNQEEINRNLEKISNNRNYTFDNAYIELNPYKLSPLSAIIIYYSKTKDEVSLYINGEFVTTMEATNNHIIPIYGLFEDYKNIIKLVSNGEEVEYEIETDKSNIEYPLEVVKRSKSMTGEDLYFTVASYKTYLTAWDINGRLRFYLTNDNRMDVEWLDNGHFLIGTTEGEFAENFIGFLEMDYLGKIYNYYTMENGFSFESQLLENGNLMVAGGEKAVYVKEQVIYEMDLNTGKKVNEINLAQVFLNVDPLFDQTYLGQKAVRNGFYFNEKNGDVVVSFRGIDTVFSVNFYTHKLNWIFTSPDNELFKSEVWDKYKVKSKKNNYPWGIHSPQITKDGLIAFFNNGYNRYKGFENGGNDLVSYYKKNYSRAEIYKIKDKKATLVWKFDDNKKLFSHQYGSIRVSDDNHKLVNFGFTLNDDYRKREDATLSFAEEKPDNITAHIFEIDEKDHVIFYGKFKEGKYRVFKHKLYNDTTSNADINKLNIFNTIPSDNLAKSSTKEININEASKWINSIEFTKNTFKTDYGIEENDDIELLFVNKTGGISILKYKDASTTQKNRIFNVELSGKQSLYIKINDIVYDPKIIVQF